jgi:hypothetical protein
MWGTIIPVRGRACQHRPGPGNPPRGEVAGGSGAGWQSWGQGRGRRFCGAAAAAVMPGGIRLCHCQPDARSHRPGPAPVGGMVSNLQRLAGMMARLSLPACPCRPIVVVVARGSILLGHGVAPGGARYANRLEGWMILAPIWPGCELWHWKHQLSPPLNKI